MGKNFHVICTKRLTWRVFDLCSGRDLVTQFLYISLFPSLSVFSVFSILTVQSDLVPVCFVNSIRKGFHVKKLSKNKA